MKPKPQMPACSHSWLQTRTWNSFDQPFLKPIPTRRKLPWLPVHLPLKCFSVSQIRLLAAFLYLINRNTDLMDAARLHIADHDHFRELADMYTDKNFQRKFLVMAEKRS